jgi:PAS domain S-box-containing protein
LVRTTEEKLFGTTDIYRVIVDAAEEGIWVEDEEDRVTFVNRKLVDILGYPRNEILGKRIFDFTDEKNRAIMRESMERSHKGIRETYVFSLRNKSGEFIPVLAATTPMQDEKGRYIGTIQLCSDLTVQKNIEDELREAKAKADMYLDLLSHDIRNMDQVAIGYLEIVMNKLDACECLTKENRELIEKPLRSLYSSADLISTIKNLQKIKSARLPLERIDLGEIVSGVVKNFTGVPGRLIKIHYSPAEECWVEANYLLKDVFINLIGNAIKYSNGPLDINISINPVTSHGIRYYAVTVEDDGPGIPDELKSKLFSHAYCEGTKTIGRGLGLCLVKELVDKFCGEIRVEDRVPGDYKKGTRFVVMFPVA